MLADLPRERSVGQERGQALGSLRQHLERVPGGEGHDRPDTGNSLGALADGWQHGAYVVPSGEPDRLRETIEVSSDAELVRELRQAWPNACGTIATSRADSGRVLSELLQ